MQDVKLVYTLTVWFKDEATGKTYKALPSEEYLDLPDMWPTPQQQKEQLDSMLSDATDGVDNVVVCYRMKLELGNQYNVEDVNL